MPANGFEAQPQDLVMTFLGAYATPRERPIWSGGLVTLLGDFGFSTGASRVALSRMVTRGGLERVRNGRLVSYRPTPRTVAPRKRAAGVLAISVRSDDSQAGPPAD